jgi:hypothetical protein
MNTATSMTNASMALDESPLGRLVDQQGSPLLELIAGKIPADDAFVVQLACEALHVIIKERFATSGGVKTTVGGVVSSVPRFEWIMGWSDGVPGWLRRWDEDTCTAIAGAGGLDVLKHVREQGCEGTNGITYQMYVLAGWHFMYPVKGAPCELQLWDLLHNSGTR